MSSAPKSNTLNAFQTQWTSDFPWKLTPMGEPMTWPELLKQTLNVITASSQPMFVVWGRSHYFFPNQALAAFLQLPMKAVPVQNIFGADVFQDDILEATRVTAAWQRRHFYGHQVVLNTIGEGEQGGVLGMAVPANVQEQDLEDFYMAAPIGMALVLGPSHRIAYTNKRLAALLNQTVSALHDRPIGAVLPEPVIREFEAVMARVARTGTRFIARDIPFNDPVNPGQKIYFKFHFEPYQNASGTVKGAVIMADETTGSVVSRQKIKASEVAHKLAIEAARMGSFEFDLHTKVFVYSERFATIFGHQPTDLQLTQADFVNQILPEDQQIRLDAYHRIAQSGKLFYEVRIKWPNGEVRWIRIDGKVINGPDGVPHKIFGTLLEVTDQKTYEQTLERRVTERTLKLKQKNNALRASEERFQRMTEEVQDYAILLLDRAGHILNWNKGAQQIKGYEESEIIGKHIRIFYMDRDREERLPERLVSQAETEGRAIHEGYRVRKDGTLFWGSIAITALHDNAGRIIGFSKVTRDLTERKKAEDQLKKYTAELEFQNRELEQFAYIASHDLQEPLRKIQMFSGMIGQHLNDKAAVEKYFSKINTSAARMSELIRSVLHYSRLSKIEEPQQRVDLDEILAGVLVDFELLIEERGAVIVNDPLPTIPGIALQLSQLFTNLIGNALKFSTQEPRIDILTRRVSSEDIPFEHNLLRGAQYCEIIIRDNGIGFDQKYASQIFTIFQRLNQNSSFTGTGIGLALCKKIVGNHKGFITAESEPGQGASFFIYLPENPNPLVRTDSQ